MNRAVFQLILVMVVICIVGCVSVPNQYDAEERTQEQDEAVSYRIDAGDVLLTLQKVLDEYSLQIAAQAGHKDAVEGLLAEGVLPNFALVSCATARDKDAVALLLSAGVDVNATSEDGDTALMHAAENGDGELVVMLIAEGADVNAKTEKGETALAMATRGGHIEIRDLLIEAGASE